MQNDRILLRIPPELKDKLRHAAYQNRRSVNAEIVHRLEHTFGEDNHRIPDKSSMESQTG